MARVKMLLVEDDAALAELLVFHFKREDFEVVHTPDGEEALLLAYHEAKHFLVQLAMNSASWSTKGGSGGRAVVLRTWHSSKQSIAGMAAGCASCTWKGAGFEGHTLRLRRTCASEPNLARVTGGSKHAEVPISTPARSSTCDERISTL